MQLHDAIVATCDIRGFSSFMRRHDPTTVLSFINSFWSSWESQVLGKVKTKPTVKKGLGDGIMTFWLLPESGDLSLFRSVHSTLLAACQDFVLSAAAGRLRQSSPIPEDAPQHLGVGIFTGPIAPVNLGGDEKDEATDWIGTALNFSARLQDQCRPTGIIVSAVPAFMPTLDGLITEGFRDTFTHTEYFGEDLKGVLGTDSLLAYAFHPLPQSSQGEAALSERPSPAAEAYRNRIDKLGRILDQGDDRAVHSAIIEVRQFRLRELVASLWGVVEDPTRSDRVRSASLAAYALLLRDKADSKLRDVLSGDDPELISTAIQAAGELHLLGCLRSAESTVERLGTPMLYETLARAIGNAQDREGRANLIAMVKNEHPSVRSAAVSAMAKLHDADSISTLRDRLMGAESMEIVQFEIINALGKIHTEEALRVLSDATQAHEGLLLTQICRILGEIADPLASVALLEVALARDRFIEARIAAINALGKIKDPGSLNGLLELLEDESERIKGAAVESIAVIDPRGASSELFRLAEDSELPPKLRAAAVTTLAKSQEGTFYPKLAGLLSGAGEYLAAKVAIALGDLGDPRAVEDLRRLILEGESKKVRISAAVALAEIDATIADDVVIAAAEREENPRDLIPFLAVLAKKKVYSALDPLSELASNPKVGVGVRGAAIESLASLGGPDAFYVLVSLVEDDDEGIEVRRRAAGSLGAEAFRTVEAAERIDRILKGRASLPNEVRQVLISVLHTVTTSN